MPTKRPAHRPRKYPRGVTNRVVKMPLSEADHARILFTTTPEQRAAVLLKLCDDIDAVKRPQP